MTQQEKIKKMHDLIDYGIISFETLGRCFYDCYPSSDVLDLVEDEELYDFDNEESE